MVCRRIDLTPNRLTGSARAMFGCRCLGCLPLESFYSAAIRPSAHGAPPATAWSTRRQRKRSSALRRSRTRRQARHAATAHECCASDLLLRVVSKLVGQRETFAGVSTPPRVNVAATASRTVSPSNIRDSAKKGAPGALEVVDAMSKAAPAVVVVLRPEDEARLKASSENVRSELSPGCWRRIPSADRTRNRSSSTRVTGMPTM